MVCVFCVRALCAKTNSDDRVIEAQLKRLSLGSLCIRLMTADALYDLMRHNRRMCDRIVSKAMIEEYGWRREVAPSSKTESEIHGERISKSKERMSIPAVFSFFSRWGVKFRRSRNQT